MKRTATLRYSLIGLTAMTLLFSCSKDNDSPKAPAARILGKWNLVKESEVSYAYNTGAFKDSSGVTIPSGLFTVEFRTDGKMYTMENDNGQIDRDTLSYEVHSETHMTINGDDYNIGTFTNNNLITTDYYDDGTSDVKHVLEFKK